MALEFGTAILGIEFIYTHWNASCKQYPCYINRETEIDHEPDWGDGINKYYHFYYL